jgi:hypothetical protein
MENLANGVVIINDGSSDSDSDSDSDTMESTDEETAEKVRVGFFVANTAEFCIQV